MYSPTDFSWQMPRPNSSLKKWLQEASDLLLGMGREERNTSANELQQFVVKTLQAEKEKITRRFSSFCLSWELADGTRFSEMRPMMQGRSMN